MRPKMRTGNQVHTLATEAYKDEKELQSFIAASPDILQLHEINPNFDGAFTVGTECWSPRGSVRMDALLMNADGYVTLVETKLATNPEQAREVVAQCINYLVELPTRFEQLEAYYRKYEGKPDASLFERARKEDPEIDEEEFRALVEDRLRSRDVLVMIVGDRIKNPERLVAMVRHLDGGVRGGRARFGVVSVRKFAWQGNTLYVPVTHGKMFSSHRTEIEVTVISGNERMAQTGIAYRDVDLLASERSGGVSAAVAKSAITPEGFRDALMVEGLGDVDDYLLKPCLDQGLVDYGVSMAVVRARVADFEVPVFYVDSKSMAVRVSTNTTKTLRKIEPGDLGPVERLHAAFLKALPQAKLIDKPTAKSVTAPLTPGAGPKLAALFASFVSDLNAMLSPTD